MKEKTYNKPLTIFLIDDKTLFSTPSWEDIRDLYLPYYFEDIREKEFDVNIPFVKDDTKYTGKNPDIGFQNFRLYWFRNTKEVKTFLEYSKHIINQKGFEFWTEKTPIPDIVLFDYALTGDGDYQMYNPLPKELALKLMPSEILKELTDINISIEDKPATGREIDNDNEGAYCSGEITSLFQDNPVVSIATTRKTEHTIKNQEVALYEYLKKSSFNVSFEKKGATNLKWHIILPEAVRLLRKNILNYLNYNKISIDLNNIITLLDCFSSQEKLVDLYNNTFKYKSAYSWRELPLHGLFIDCETEANWVYNQKDLTLTNTSNKGVVTSLSERQFKIWEFLHKVLAEVMDTSDKTNENVIRDVQKISDILWDTYTSTEKFERRMELSDLHFRKLNKITLFEANKALYSDHKHYFNVTEDDKFPAEECVNIELFFNRYNPTTVRLAIGHLIARLCIRYAALEKEYGKRKAYSAPDQQEIYNILNPIKNTETDQNLVLPMHLIGVKKGTKYCTTDIFDRFGKGLQHDLGIPRSKWHKMEWLSSGEKKIIQAFFVKDIEFYPNWLK